MCFLSSVLPYNGSACDQIYVLIYISGLKYINRLKSMCLKRQEEMPWIQTTKSPPTCAVAAAIGQVPVNSSEGKDG